MANERLQVTITADASQLKTTLKSVQADFQSLKQEVVNSAGDIKEALIGPGTAIAVGVGLLLHKLKQVFKAGLDEIDSFRRTTINIAATLTDLAEEGQGSIEQVFRRNLGYAQEMYKVVEREAARHFASGREMIEAWTILTQKGVILRQEEVKALGDVVDKIKLVTQGQMASIQIAQELRSLLSGQARATDQLGMLLRDRYGDEWEAIVEQHRQAGDLLVWLASEFKGIGAANKEIENTIEAQVSTFTTLLAQVGREGLAGLYKDIVGLLKQANEYLVEHGAKVAGQIARAWEAVRDIIQGVVGFISDIQRVYVVTIRFVAEVVGAGAKLVEKYLAPGMTDIMLGFGGGERPKEEAGLIRYGTEGEGHVGTQPPGPAKTRVMAPPPTGGGGGGKVREIDYARLLERELKAELDLMLTRGREALELLRAQSEERKAVLKQEFETGKIDGAAYYAELARLQAEYHGQAIRQIDAEIEATRRLYEAQRANIEANEKLQPAERESALRVLALEYEAKLTKLQGDRAKAQIEQSRKLADLTKEEHEWRAKIADLLEEGREALALGPIAEKEAEINRLLRERARLRLQMPEEMRVEFDQQTRALAWRRTIGEEIESWATTIAHGFRSLFESITEGTAEMRQAIHGFFKALFSQALETGFKQLTQWLMNALKQMFGALGSGLASAVLGVIGLVGMLLTGGGGGSSWSPTGATTGLTATNQALRGVIAGETSIPIAQISESLEEALSPHLHVLRQIEQNTRAGGALTVNIRGVREAIKGALEEYFREALVVGVS